MESPVQTPANALAVNLPVPLSLGGFTFYWVCKAAQSTSVAHQLLFKARRNCWQAR
jgi:hypothetical protein